jgi:uncharacterized C2H2 Zn-finger protein
MERVEFVIIETDGFHETLACPKCGNIFEIDVHTELNLVFDKEYMGLVSKCPDCGALQKGDEELV